MATVSSTTTNAELWAAYDDNASYEEDGSRTKALAFKTCCMILLRRRPNMATRGEQQMSFESIKLQLEDVSAWLEAHPSSSGETGHRTRYFAMENYRG